ncbi:MAG: CDP-alcohol phosphatidyltransferase family protein, partial [Oscillospiraceae bacterium]
QFMVAVCLIVTIKYMFILVLIVFIKELFQGICCLILLKKDQKLDGAKWFGKVSTACFYAVMVALLIFPLPQVYQTILIAIASGFMLLSLVLYIHEFLQMDKKSRIAKQ